MSLVSDNEEVVEVLGAGVLKAKSVGTARITATSEDGGHTASCQVTVLDAIRLTGIGLDSTMLTLKVRDSRALKVIFMPADATDQRVEWTTSNAGVATVSGGTVVGVSAGQATITATSHDGGFTAACAVTVVEGETPTSVASHLLSGVRIAPNPFGSQLTLRHAGSLLRYELLSVSGAVELTGSHDGADEVVLRTGDLPSGVYLLRLHALDGVRVVRLVKR